MVIHMVMNQGKNKVSEIIKKLSEIQLVLNAPKSQRNNFGKYNYRSCEDILQAVKPLLGESVILVSDEIKVFLDRVYVEATAKFCFGSETIEVKALARESLDKKGMDSAQITGAASSYARKYALNGLLLIDDNKDADSQDNSKSESFKPLPKQELTTIDKGWITAVKADNSVLETITDVNYKAMIKKEAGI